MATKQATSDSRAVRVRFGLGSRFSLVVLLLLVSAAPAAAAISFVTSGSGTGINVCASCPTTNVTVTPTAATGGNNTVVVVVAFKNTSVSDGFVSVVDSGGSLYTLQANGVANGTSSRVRLYSTEAGTSKDSTWIRVSIAGGIASDIVVTAASYSGVVSLGATSTSSANTATQTISMTIENNNNWVVAGFAGAGAATPNPTSPTPTGNLRGSAVANGTIGGALNDNTSASAAPVSVPNAVNIPGPEWTAMAALELRTTWAFSAQGQCGAGGHKASSNFFTFTSNSSLDVGSLAVIVVATDNIQLSDGPSITHQSIGDTAGNAWTKIREFTNDEGGAGTGAAVSIWYSKVSATLASGGTFTVTLNGLATAKGATCWKFRMGDLVAVDGGADLAATAAAGPGSITLSGLTNISHLWLRGSALEFPFSTWTATTNYASFSVSGGTSGGANASNIVARGEFRVVTATSQTTNPTTTVTGADYASTMVALSGVLCGVSESSYVAANAQSGQATVYWSSVDPMIVLRKAGAIFSASEAPQHGTVYTAGATPWGGTGPTVIYDGATAAAGTTCTATSCTSTGLTNGTKYYYKVFPKNGTGAMSCYAKGTINPSDGLLAAPAASAPQWSYATTAASMAPVALDPWSNIVVAGSNDTNLHGMSDSDGTIVFAPFATGGPIQARAAVVPAGFRRPSTGVNVAYVTSQDGFAYAVNTSTGGRVWKACLNPAPGPCDQPLGTTLQGGAGVWLQAFAPVTFTGNVTDDVVVVGTRNTGAGSDTNNKVYAINGATGAIVWTFAPGNMDIISSVPYLDYANGTAWVTSRSKSGAQPMVWKLDAATGNAATGIPLASWNNTTLLESDTSASAGIDISPSPSADGTFVYVGTNAGNLKAIKVSDGTVCATCTHTPASGTGAIRGAPWWLSYDPVGVATPDTIIFVRNTTVHSVNFNGSTFSPNWTQTLTWTPSSPVDDAGNAPTGNLYFGGSDGKVHRLRVSDGTDLAQAPPTAITGTFGEPTINWDRGVIHVGGSDGHIYTFAVGF